MDLRGKPLNGEKTHPLKRASLDVLQELATNGPIERYRVNAGVVDRLTRDLDDPLAELTNPPFGQHVRLQITAAGLAEVKRRGLTWK